MSEKITLNESDQVYILANYMVPGIGIKELAQTISGDPKQNGQTKLGRAIREFLASKGLEYATTKFVKQGELELSEENINFIEQNKSKMKPFEMTKLLFGADIAPLGKEYKAVQKYLEQTDPAFIPKEEKLTGEDYEAPTSIARLIPRVNKYVLKSMGDETKFLDKDKLTVVQIRNLKALIGYMNVYQFIYQAGLYKREVDMELFESNFVRFCYDKPDLLEEEVNDYIALCSEIVLIAQIDRRVQSFDNEIQTLIDGDDNKKRLSMTFVDAMKNEIDKLNQAKTKRDKLKETLIGSRNKRIDGKIQQTASLHSLVEMWKKEEDRKKIIAMAKKRQGALVQEVERLSSIDALKAEIYGLDKDDIIR